MRALSVALLLVLPVASAACSARRFGSGPGGVAFDRDAETKAVYAQVLNELYARDWVGREIQQWVVDPEVPAVVGGRNDVVRAQVGDAGPDTLADYERPRPAGRVPTDLVAGRPVRWFTRGEFAALPKQDGAGSGWAAFHETFPGSPGHVTLSHIGFSSDGTEALVQPGCWFDSLGGARSLVRLKKVRGAWRVIQSQQTAIS